MSLMSELLNTKTTITQNVVAVVWEDVFYSDLLFSE